MAEMQCFSAHRAHVEVCSASLEFRLSTANCGGPGQRYGTVRGYRSLHAVLHARSRHICKAQQQPGTAIERADTGKGSLGNVIQETLLSPFTGVPIALAAVGAYLAGYGLEGAAAGQYFFYRLLWRLTVPTLAHSVCYTEAICT